MRSYIHRSVGELPLSSMIGHLLCFAMGIGMAVLTALYGGTVGAVTAVYFAVGLFIAALSLINMHADALHRRLDGVQREIEVLRIAMRSSPAGEVHE